LLAVEREEERETTNERGGRGGNRERRSAADQVGWDGTRMGVFFFDCFLARNLEGRAR
jgi:hypothetical protein